MEVSNILSSRPYIIKDKGFCPNPIALYGIPEYADSQNKKVIGTVNYEDYWNEQIDYCINGYNTGGLWIPGRYYFYLNFCYMATVGRGYHLPDFVDTDYYYFRLIEEIKLAGLGMITLKARRRGLSEKWAKGICGYGLRFTPEKYKAGIAAGLSDYTDNLFSKVKELNHKLPPEFRLNWTINNTNEVIYTYLDDEGLDIGSGNMVMAATMNTNPNVLKSNYFNDVAFEEAGEFEHVIAGFGATKDSFKVGNKMIGTPYIFGTGGNIKSQSKGFCEMWYKSEDYKLVKLEVYGQHLMIRHFIGSRNEAGEIEEDCPNIIRDNPGLTRDQLLGCEDVHRGLELIEQEKKVLAASQEKQQYYDYLQNLPTNEKEAFLKFSGNPFNQELLAFQSHQIFISEPRYKKFKLEYKKSNDGQYATPLEIGEVIEIPDDSIETDVIYILEGGHPIKGFLGLEVGGVDSYDLDESATSRSLGSMVVKRRPYANVPFSNYPLALIRCRPKRKEIFYDLCLKLSVYYKLYQNVLIDVRCSLIMQFFKDHHGKVFLAKRPQSFESEHSEQMHEFGIAMTTFSKPLMLAGIQTYVEDHCEKIWFPQLVAEIKDYDITVKEVDSDWDAADAFGYALAQEKNLLTLHRIVQEEAKQGQKDPFELKNWNRQDNQRSLTQGNYYYPNGKPITDLFQIMMINQSNGR